MASRHSQSMGNHIPAVGDRCGDGGSKNLTLTKEEARHETRLPVISLNPYHPHRPAQHEPPRPIV